MMPTTSLGPQGLLICALAFDDRKEDLITTSLSLAKRFGMAIKLVNVVETPMYDSLSVETPNVISIPAIIAEDMSREVKERRMELDALIHRMRQTGAEVSGEVLEGDAIRAIITAAVSSRANLIITGCHPAEHRFVPQGFSTALSLMHEAPLPVLVLGARPLDFTKKDLRLLIADDLDKGTEEAVRKGLELACLAPKTVVKHVHVHGDFRELIRDSWVDIKARIPGLRELDTTPEDLWHREYEARLTALKGRQGAWAKLAEKKEVTIDSDVRTGQVGAEIGTVVQDFDPDLLIFGRHRLMRAKPFLIGRMPLRSMIKERRTVLVVPPKEDLYARLPFPAAAR